MSQKSERQTWTQQDAQAHRAMLERRAARLKPIVLPLTYLTMLPARNIARWLGKEHPFYRTLLGALYADMDAAFINAFNDYELQRNDVVVCAYFKSGTNWMMQTAYQIAHHGDGDYDYIYDVIPWPDGPDRKIPISLHDPAPYQSSSGQRIIKSHSIVDHVPLRPEAKYIVMTRDPKDVVVSGYYFFEALLFGPLVPSIEAWVDIFISDQAIQGSWHEFVAGWWPLRNEPNVLFMTYEEMRKDTDESIRTVADFMDVDLTPEMFTNIQERTSFAYMKSIDHKLYPPRLSPLGYPDGVLVRKGQSGSSGELLSVELQQHIDDYCRAQLEVLGCDFPYDALYGNQSPT
ncbi:MAG: sulfotransferase domain-containing protein [Chloroflexota bacterium]